MWDVVECHDDEEHKNNQSGDTLEHLPHVEMDDHRSFKFLLEVGLMSLPV